MCSHLESFSSLSTFQSAYRKFHSTETALTRIFNDLLLAMNNQNVSALVLLYLSAAFNTIDHTILVKRVNVNFDFSGMVFSLLLSYLSNRSQSVLVGQASSPEQMLDCGCLKVLFLVHF